MPVSSFSSNSVSTLPKIADTPARNTVWETEPPLHAEKSRWPRLSHKKQVIGKPCATPTGRETG
jgi:hypothetical protein